MWYYNNKEFQLDIIDSKVIGFVYLITNVLNNRKYIGKKVLFNRKKKPPLKGKKNKRHFLVESDWKEYYGSNDELKAHVEEFGCNNFKREILHLCYNKTELSYLELKEQMDRNVLLSDIYYNKWISCRITERGLNDLKERISIK